MKFSLFSFTLLALATTALGKFNGKKIAQTIDKEATHLKPGKYRFVNVASRKGLKYQRNGQSLYAAKGKGDWISIKTHHAHIVLSPSASNNKCVSTAWSPKHGYNAYAAIYECAVTKFKRDGLWNDKLETRQFKYNTIGFDEPLRKRALEKRVALRGAKQYLYCHRAHRPHTYHIVAYDHITDMPTRVLSDCVVKPEWQKKGSTRYSCLVPLNEKDMHQAWYIYNSKGKLV